MKIIVFSNSLAVAAGAVPEVTAGADSAILRPGEPVFLSDDSAGADSWIVSAVRIGRLGTHIPAAAAEAYIDAHTLFHLLMPAGADAIPGPLWGLTDRTFSPGKWLSGSIAEGQSNLTATKSSLWHNQSLQTLESIIDITASTARSCVAAISKYSTLKTGDVLIFADLPAVFPARPDTRLTAALNGEQVLDFKIK